jgi:hypothetical protein
MPVMILVKKMVHFKITTAISLQQFTNQLLNSPPLPAARQIAGTIPIRTVIFHCRVCIASVRD